MTIARIARSGAAAVLLAAVLAGCTDDGREPPGRPMASRGAFSGQCTPEELPLPAGVAHDVGQLAMDPTGRFIVSMTTGVLWDNGTPSQLSAPGGPTAVNEHGWVLLRRPYQASAVLVDAAGAAEVKELPPPDGSASAWPSGMNGHGDVVGVADNGSTKTPVIWSPDANGEYHSRVPTLQPAGIADGIDDDGTLVGVFGHRPYVWSADGTGRALSVPDGAVIAQMTAIRGGWALGTTLDNHLLRWDLVTGDMSDMGTVGQPYPPGLNAYGDVAVNRKPDQPQSGDDGGPVLVRDGQSYDLPLLPGVDAFDAALFTRVTGVTDDGTMIAGSQRAAEGGSAAVLWRC